MRLCTCRPSWPLLLLAVGAGTLLSLYPAALRVDSEPRAGARSPLSSRILDELKQWISWTGKPCQHLVRGAIQQHPCFRRLFDPSTPVLLSWDHVTPELWARLSQRKAPYGWQGLSRQAITSTLSLLNGSDDAELFGGLWRQRPRCVRCAVVGNGGILNGSRQGPSIDAHNFVFRLNGAVVRGFEQDVGTRTSFYGFTANTLKNSLVAYRSLGFTSVPQGQDLRYIIIPSGIRDYVMLRSALLGEEVPEGRDKGDRPQKYFGPDAPAGKFKLLHPDFISYLTERFLKSKNIETKFGDLYMPSTGALMLFTALHSCDQVSAYGFITSNYRKFSSHYFERVRKPLVFYVNHDLLLEATLWKSLHEAGILWLYQAEPTRVPATPTPLEVTRTAHPAPGQKPPRQGQGQSETTRGTQVSTRPSATQSWC